MSKKIDRLVCIDQRDRRVTEELMAEVYGQLRRLAQQRLSREKRDQTLQATELVHEAYVRLVDGEVSALWNGSGHFVAAAREAMRRILVERARRRARLKHGGSVKFMPLEQDMVAGDAKEHTEVLAVREALGVLELHDTQAAELVRLRYFASMSHQEAARVLGLSRRQADRLWRVARAWLFRTLRPECEPSAIDAARRSFALRSCGSQLQGVSDA